MMFIESSYRFPFISILILVSICGVLLIAPWIVMTILFAVVAIMCVLECIKLHLWSGFKSSGQANENIEKPKISVHLAVCNEPPEMVISTIRSIINQDYPDFEIIVVDNNTKDKKLWEPVSLYCRQFPNIRFFHLENWPFYKSGALNFARKVTHSNSKFIFVLDADYELVPSAISQAVSHVAGPEVGLVQFPQAYISSSPRQLPIMNEFDHFFDYYCFKADTCRGALGTGTLSLIRIDSLDSVGGWPTNSVTEDAELGARLQYSGLDIKYVHRIIGRGIAPIHQIDFVKQRKRWIYGNAQTLVNYSMRPWHNFGKWLSGICQLTAWANLLGFPIMVLLAAMVIVPLVGFSFVHDAVVVSYAALWIFAMTKFLQISLSQGRKTIDAFQTFLIHFATMDIGAFHWWPALLGKTRPFVKTDKSGQQSGYFINLLYPFMHLSVLVVSLNSGSLLIPFCALFFLSVHLMSIKLDYECRADFESGTNFCLKLYP